MVHHKGQAFTRPGLMATIGMKFQQLMFRYGQNFLSPASYLPTVPSSQDLTPRTGRLSLEIVSHCWNYSHMLAYSLSSYVNYPPQEVDVTVTVFHSSDDQRTVDMLAYFGKIEVPGVNWNWQKLPTEQLLRRAIGRNQAALSTHADWVWFADCDLIFHKGCLDALSNELQGRKDLLLFPLSENITSLLKDDNQILNNGNAPKVVDIEPEQFFPNSISRAVGAYQIVNAEVARICGYCNNISIYQTPTDHWQKTYEDRTFRWLIRSQGEGIQVPGIYRIRHISKGRYKQSDSKVSKIRSWIRLAQSKLKSQEK